MQFNKLELQNIIDKLISDPTEVRSMVSLMNNLLEPIARELLFIHEGSLDGDTKARELIGIVYKIPHAVISDGILKFLDNNSTLLASETWLRNNLINMTFHATFIGIPDDTLCQLVRGHCSRLELGYSEEEAFCTLCLKTKQLFRQSLNTKRLLMD